MTEDEQNSVKKFIDRCEKEGIIDNREFPCPECETGEMKHVGHVSPGGLLTFECTDCEHTETYP